MIIFRFYSGPDHFLSFWYVLEFMTQDKRIIFGIQRLLYGMKNMVLFTWIYVTLRYWSHLNNNKIYFYMMWLVPYFEVRFWKISGQSEEEFFATTIRSLLDEKSLNQLYINLYVQIFNPFFLGFLSYEIIFCFSPLK